MTAETHLRITLVDAAANPALAQAALELVTQGIPSEQRAAQRELLQAALKAPAAALLLSAQREEHLVGAVFAQLMPGRAAGVWPPELAEGANEAVAVDLLAALEEELATREIDLAQSLLAADASRAAERLMAAGYRHAAELLYLVSEAEQFPHDPPRLPFKLQAFDSARPERFARLLEATYVGTLDCPSLDNMRDAADVLTGYRAIGEFRAELWLIASHQGEDVGCLLLADHPQLGHWELVYMGLVPAVRGRGWGLELARHAQWLAREAGQERILLGVDANNHPALRMYATCGFEACDQRRVLVRSVRSRGKS